MRRVDSEDLLSLAPILALFVGVPPLMTVMLAAQSGAWHSTHSAQPIAQGISVQCTNTYIQ